jgi:hypothetical protein
MKTSDLVQFLATEEFTDAEAYNLLVSDLFEAVPIEQIEHSQRLVQFFEYKIRGVCLATIRQLRGLPVE